MLTAISRYGARVLPITEDIVAGCKARGEFIQGPQIAEFEAAFARRHGLGPAHAITAAYGRIAFYYMLKALDLPAGSEIIFPSLTFWVVPELARVAGLTVVFADVDPKTFNIDPDSVERLITDKTRAIVPTHLYGLPCDMDRLMAIAARHNLIVLEDCAHALGATYKGRPVGTFGAGALFSFQTLKPLNCYGGGLALVTDPAIAAKVRATGRGAAVAERKTRHRAAADGPAAAHFHEAMGVLDLALSGAVGLGAHRRQPRRVLLGKDPIAAAAARAVHRAFSQRAGGDRPGGAQASRRVDRRRRRPTPPT